MTKVQALSHIVTPSDDVFIDKARDVSSWRKQGLNRIDVVAFAIFQTH
ncbi:hypothetical protein [Aeromonas sobria]|jgi:hypothetical protein|nr:hypothetical protein [Aeromonas sobria]